MQQFRSLVVALEPGQSAPVAFDRVVCLARACGAEVNLISVIEDVPAWARRVMPHSVGLALDALVPSVRRQLEEAADRFGSQLTVRTEVLHGRPYVEIQRVAVDRQADLVVKPACEDNSVGFDFRLLRRCPCAVWILKGNDTPFQRVAAALHVGRQESQRDALNCRIMELASSFAALEKSELYAVQAWSYFAEAPLRHKVRTERSETLIDQAKERSARDLRAAIERLVEPYRVDHPNLTLHMSEGEPEDVIPSVVHDEEEVLLVMGTIGRSGVSGMLMGNLTERVMNRLPCSILAVKATQQA
jgi:universal stress protein E